MAFRRKQLLVLLSIFTPLGLGDKLKLFLNLKDETSVTVDVNEKISQIDDLSGNNNHFTQATGSKQPLKKVISLITDGVDDNINLPVGSTSIDGDTQGEFMFMANRKTFDKFFPFFSLADDTVNTNYIWFGLNGFSAGGGLGYRSKIGAPLTTLRENVTYKEYENLGFQIYSVSSDGLTIKFYRNGIEITVDTLAGTNDGDWFGADLNRTFFSLGSLIYSPPFYASGDIASIIYSDEVLTVQERADVLNWMKNEYFGMNNPLNFETQTIPTVSEYVNSRYNWTGGMSINPINNKVVSIWDKGDSHYLLDDIHDIVGHLSDDNFATFGSEFVVFQGAGDISYTNASVGYSSDGRLHCVATKVKHNPGAKANIGIFTKYSDNDGVTWSSEYSILGITDFVGLNGNSNIIESTDGNLYSTFYEIGTNVNLQCIRSTDNGTTWSIYSTIDIKVWTAEGINETTIKLIGTNTLLAITRVQARNYYKQYISIDNGLSWTDQGDTNLSDWWTSETSGVSSNYVHLVRIDTFDILGTKVVGLIYLNRGVGTDYGDTYLRVVFGKAQDLIDLGVNGWSEGAGIKIKISGETLDNQDGYPDILFYNNNSKALIRNFLDTSADQSVTKIQYLDYEFNLNFLKKSLNI